MVKRKVCTKCNRERLSKFYYSSPSGKHGLMAQCKDCFKVQVRRNEVNRKLKNLEPTWNNFKDISYDILEKDV